MSSECHHDRNDGGDHGDAVSHSKRYCHHEHHRHQHLTAMFDEHWRLALRRKILRVTHNDEQTATANERCHLQPRSLTHSKGKHATSKIEPTDAVHPFLHKAIIRARAYELIPTDPESLGQLESSIVPKQLAIRTFPVKVLPRPSSEAHEGAESQAEQQNLVELFWLLHCRSDEELRGLRTLTGTKDESNKESERAKPCPTIRANELGKRLQLRVGYWLFCRAKSVARNLPSRLCIARRFLSSLRALNVGTELRI